jgi:hypothetical protein
MLSRDDIIGLSVGPLWSLGVEIDARPPLEVNSDYRLIGHAPHHQAEEPVIKRSRRYMPLSTRVVVHYHRLPDIFLI